MVWTNVFSPQADSTVPEIDPTADVKKEDNKQQSSPPPPPPQYECDFEDRPSLYKKIEDAEWEDVITFLDTGKWPTTTSISSLFSGTSDTQESPKVQAMTVVVAHSDADERQEEQEQEKGGDTTTPTTSVLWRRLPLQQAIMSDAGLDVVQRLVQLYPESVRWANNYGQLALHLAMLFSSDDVIAFLISEYPESVQAKTKMGSTPLQAALKAERKDRGMIMAVILNFTKDNVTDPDAEAPFKEISCEYHASCKRLCPLYIMIERQEWESVLQLFDQGYTTTGTFANVAPDMMTPVAEQVKTWITCRDLDKDLWTNVACCESNNNDSKELWTKLPLHEAAYQGAPISIVQRLVEMYPHAVRYADDQGMLPIHLAFLNNADDDVVSKLLLAYPDSVNKKTPSGLTPLDCALLAPNNTARGEILDAFLTAKMNPDQISKDKTKKYTTTTKTTSSKTKNEMDAIEQTRE